MAYMFFILTIQYVLPVLVFSFAYGHIFLVIRRSNKVFQVPDDNNARQQNSEQVSFT